MPSATLLAFVSLLILGLILHRVGPSAHPWGAVWREGPLLPLLAMATTCMLTAWIWGGLKAIPVWYDESAYLLQAELVADGRLAGPALPIPDAFAQPAVIVDPVLAPKMPLGHAIVLAPGVWLGLPGLMPALLSGLTAAMLVLLARRILNTAVAVIALGFWWTQAGQWRWRASYLSETTTGLLWLVAWWCLLEWRSHRQRRWLILLAASIGYGAITRPLTMLAFALPVMALVLWDTFQTGRWRDMALGAIVGSMILLLLPLQNKITLGDWRSSPLALYTEQYLPFDRPGFGLDSTPPLRAVPPELEAATAALVALHAEHTPDRLPIVLLERLGMLFNSLFADWRVVLIPVALVGAIILPRQLWFALGTVMLLYLAYLSYAHETQWTAYYAEAMPVLAFSLATGAAEIARRILRASQLGWPAATGLLAVLLVAGAPGFEWSRRFRRAAEEPLQQLNSVLAANPSPRALVFVRRGPALDPHMGFVRNVVDPEAARVLLVHDRGGVANTAVRRAFPERSVHTYDAGTGTLSSGIPQ